MDGCNEGSGDGQPMLYDSVPLASWSIPDLGSGQYDVIDDADVDALAEPRQVAPSRCRRFVDALCGLSGRLKPLTDDDERKAMQAASSRWHLAAHRRTVVVGAFTGVYCIRIQKDNLAASLKFHDLFKQKPMSNQDSAAALFHTPSHFVWNEDGTLLACHFAGRCYVYDSSRPLRRLNKILSVPVKGDVVSLCFIRIHDRNETTASSSPIFLCAATRQAIIYSINIGHVSGDGRFHSRRALSVARDGQPSRSSRDPVVHEFSVQHLFDGLSGVAVRDSSSTLYAFGPDSDPSNSDLDPPCNEETQSVSPRMTLKQFDIAQTMAANIDATRLQFRSLDVLGEPPGPMIDNSITPSRRRLAQLLGQSKPGMHMKQVSPLSVLNVVIRMSPCQTAIATLDGYGHVTIWRVRPRPKRVGAIVFKTPAVDISFWSDDLLVVCLGDGDLAIWSIAVRDGDSLDLSRECGIQKFEPRIRVSLSSLSPSGLFALTTLDHYLRPRVAWSEEITASGTIMRRVSLTLSSIRRVPVETALAHCLSRQAYDSALELCSRFQICADPVYQRQFASGVVSSDSISSLLCNVKTDQYWVLEQCRTRVATDAAAQKELLEYGLKQTDASSRKPSADSAVRDESAILWAYRLLFLYYLDVLETFTLIQRYDPSEFREFRSTSLRDIAIAAARADRISALQVLLHRHSRVLEPYRLEILSCIPETVPVTSYETLLPSANVSEGAIHSAGAVVASCQARDPDWVEQTSEFLSFVLKSVLTPERTPDDAVPVVDQWKAMLTETGPGVPVNVWLEERALEIDQRSGFTSNAVSLLRYGVEQFPDDVRLRDLLSAAARFSTFVYDWDGESDNHSRYVLSKFAQEDSNVARIALMLSASSAHSIVQDAVERVWPMFPDRIERRRCMVEFILERLAPQHTPLAVSLLRSESIIENPEDVARSAFGLCRVSDPANFPYISELADIANDELCFQMLRSCEICIKRRHPLPPSVFADNDHDAILSVIRSIILDEVTGISSKLLLPSQRYGGLLKDVYTLAGAERIHEAQEVFLAAIFNHGQLDVARHFSLLFDRSVFERVALREARAQFNRAGPEPSDPAMQSAHAALSLCEDNADVVEERNLHEAVERIRRFGLSSFRPIELRPGEFRVELLRKLIDCFVRRDRRHDSQGFQDIVDICSLVGIRSQDDVSDVLMRAALLANSFNHKDRAAQLATRIMTERHYRAAWKACVDFDDPSLYRHALWACPDSELLNLLDNQCANIVYDAEQHVSMDPMRCALSLVKDRGRSPQVRPDERISSLGDLVPLAAYVADVDDDHRAVQLVQRAVDNPPVDVRISVMIEFAYRCLATISVLKHQRLSVSARDMVTIDNGTLLSMLHGSPADYVTQSALNFHKSMQLCAELCQTVPNEFDGDRMVVDREYAQSAFQRLIQSLDSERIESVMSLSERCQVNLDDLVRSHMRYLFTSVQNKAELEQHVGKWGVLMLGKVKSGTIFDEVDDLVSGTDHVRRSILYRLRSSVDKSASSRLQKHISILERLQKSDIAVDYKLVLRGGSEAHAALLSAVNDRTVSVLSRLASRISELQHVPSVPPLTESTVVMLYLVSVVTAGPPRGWSQSYASWIQPYDHYFRKLPVDSVVEVFLNVPDNLVALEYGLDYVVQRDPSSASRLSLARTACRLANASPIPETRRFFFDQHGGDIVTRCKRALHAAVASCSDADAVDRFIRSAHEVAAEDSIVIESIDLAAAVHSFAKSMVDTASALSVCAPIRHEDNGFRLTFRQQCPISVCAADPKSIPEAAGAISNVIRHYPASVTEAAIRYLKEVASGQRGNATYPVRAAILSALDEDDKDPELYCLALLDSCWTPSAAPNAPIDRELLRRLALESRESDVQLCALATMMVAKPDLVEQDVALSILSSYASLPGVTGRLLRMFAALAPGLDEDLQRALIAQVKISADGLTALKVALVSNLEHIRRDAVTELNRLPGDTLHGSFRLPTELYALRQDVVDSDDDSVVALALKACLVDDLIDGPVQTVIQWYLSSRVQDADAIGGPIHCAALLCIRRRFTMAACLLDHRRPSYRRNLDLAVRDMIRRFESSAKSPRAAPDLRQTLQHALSGLSTSGFATTYVADVNAL